MDTTGTRNAGPRGHRGHRSVSPVVEAEAARQVAGVLRHLGSRFDDGHWARGARFARQGTCLVGGIDEACAWTIPGVAEQVTAELAARLPRPLRQLAALRPRLALALYNDLIGGRRGALALVRATREQLGAGPVVDATPEPTGLALAC